ncbi:MAG: hypothetical protein M0010_09760 [Actinomycetota bacterium]|nr:hypothetical protein [Actinomycetota bacterium]
MTLIGSEELEALVKLTGSLFEEARASADAKRWRGAIVLVGASIEAALLGTTVCFESGLRTQGAWPKEKRPPEDWGLATLLALAVRAGWLPPSDTSEGPVSDPAAVLAGDVGDALQFVQRLRNALAHPGRHIADLLWLDSADDELMSPTYELCERVAGEVFERLRAAMVGTARSPVTEKVGPT